jgi:hypothetical protein
MLLAVHTSFTAKKILVAYHPPAGLFTRHCDALTRQETPHPQRCGLDTRQSTP